MSVEAMTWAFKHADCSGNDRVVLLVLANHAWPDGTHAFPAHETIATEARIAERTVRDCLKRLEAAGLVTRAGKVGRTVNYSLPIIAATPAGTDIPADSRNIPADSRTDSGSRLPPNRKKEPSKKPSDSLEHAAVRAEINSSPWRPVLEPILAVAQAKGCEFVPGQIVAACEKRPDRAHSVEAERFREWWLDELRANQPIKSIAGRWRTWLTRAPPATAYQRRNGQGKRRGRGVTGDRARELSAEAEALGQ
jgi:hypothetical protein